MSHSDRRVLLVAWDGADWRLIRSLVDAGVMPNLESIILLGVIGQLATVQPQSSPLMWTSLATGWRADKHRVLGELEPDEQGGVRPVSAAARHGEAIWQSASNAGLATNVIGWPSYPAESVHGVFVSRAFALARHETVRSGKPRLPRSVEPAAFADKLGDLRISPAEFTSEELLAFVPRAALVNQTNDRSLAAISTWLAECVSIHAVATTILADEPWSFAAVYYDAIDQFSHAFMRYHEPRGTGIGTREFELYRHVMTGVYRYMDMCLGRLLELAGPEATVLLVSAHGFRSGGDRPQATTAARCEVAWHRPLGILAMRGPSVRRDEWIWGGSILDVAPTISMLLGLPADPHSDGRPLAEAFVTTPCLPATDIHESLAEEAMPAGSCHPIAPLSTGESHALIELLLDEGYISREQLDGPRPAERAADALDFNLATSLAEVGHYRAAAELFAKLTVRRPDVARFWLQLARCLLAAGDVTGCRASIAQMADRGVPDYYTYSLRARCSLIEGQYNDALAQLFALEQQDPRRAGIHIQIGEVYAAQGRWDDADRAFGKELELDADNAAALYGAGRVAMERGENEIAVERLLDALAIESFYPDAHFHLGVALVSLGKHTEAVRAFKRCLSQRPGDMRALQSIVPLQGFVDN